MQRPSLGCTWGQKLHETNRLRKLKQRQRHNYENVTNKVKLRCLKLYRAYSISFNSPNIDNFFWS